MSELRRIRAPDGKIAELLDRLDTDAQTLAAAGKGGRRGPDQRHHDRYVYRVRDLQVDMLLPGAPSVRFAACSRNISASGLACLLSSFVYAGTRCVVQLTDARGHVQNVKGVVARCRYLEGSVIVYEAGIRFDHAIDVARFSRQAVRTRVLLVDDSLAIHRLVARLLAPSNVELKSAMQAKDGVDLALKTSFDLVLMDIEMPGQDGIWAAQTLRSSGYVGPLVALTAHGSAEKMDEYRAAGFNDVLQKPVTRAVLEMQVNALKEDIVVSSLGQNSEMFDLIDDFVQTVPQRIQQLAKAQQQDQPAELARVVRQLRGEASSFGFDAINHKAAELEQVISSGADAATWKPLSEDLIRLCGRIRATKQT